MSATVSPIELNTPDTVLARLQGESRAVFELGVGPNRDVPPLQVGATHQLLARLKRNGCAVIVSLPHHDSLTPDSRILDSQRAILLLHSADQVIGQGNRDLTNAVHSMRLDAVQSLDRYIATASNLDLLSLEDSDQDADVANLPFPDIFSSLPEAVSVALGKSFRGIGVALPAPVDDPILRALSTFAKEALDNVRLHALRSAAEDHPLSGSALVSIRRLNFSDINEQQDPQLVSSTAEQWRTGMTSILRRSSATDTDIIEFTVCDSGDGIAATMRETLEIYDGPFTIERHAVVDAFSPRVTRPRTRPEMTPRSQKGFGFTQMLEALCDLRGHVYIRSGRGHYWWSSLDEIGQIMTRKEARSTLYRWEERNAILTAGTSISFLFPLDSNRPLQADLFQAVGS